MTYCIICFVLGGILMLSVTLISKHSMSFAGIISAMPIFSGTAFLINMLCKTSSEMNEQAKGGIIGMCAGLIFFATIWVALNFHIKAEGAFGIGFGVTILFVGVVFVISN